MTQVDQPEKKPVPDHASDLGPGIIREGGDRGISPSLVGRASADPRKTLVMSKGMMGTVVRAILGCFKQGRETIESTRNAAKELDQQERRELTQHVAANTKN